MSKLKGNKFILVLVMAFCLVMSFSLCASAQTLLEFIADTPDFKELYNQLISAVWEPQNMLAEQFCWLPLENINYGIISSLCIESPQLRVVTSEENMSISYRPELINNRNTPFHWEIDTVIGNKEKSAAFLVLTERLTRVELIYKIKDKSSASVMEVINKLSRKRDFKKVFHSFTCDNGREFAGLIDFKKIPVYFCHAYSSWERGSNENNNRFIRRFYPKGKNLNSVTQSQIIELLTYINSYRRKLHNGNSAGVYFNSISPVPIEKFYSLS